MFRKIFIGLSLFFLGFIILLISIFRTASVKYDFAELPLTQGESVLGSSDINIDYTLPYPGKVLPDSFFWSLKAIRDKLWLFITTNRTRKVELKILFADKRLVSSKILFEKDKAGLGYSVLTKGEKYLEDAKKDELKMRQKGVETSELLQRLALSSLKHIEVMDEIVEIAPDEAKPKIIEIKRYPWGVYEDARNALNEKGINPPENPFVR